MTGSTDDALAVFDRDGLTGALSFVAIHTNGVNGVDGLDSASSVTVSPDGAQVYVVSSWDHALAIFLVMVDPDNDGILYGADNCPLVANPAQTDTDSDGLGNVCDADNDEDGLTDSVDNCPLMACAV